MLYYQTVSLNDVLLLFNISKGNLLPVNKLLNELEINSVLDNLTFMNSLVSVPYLLFVDTNYKENDILRIMYEHERVFSIKVENTFKLNAEEYCLKLFKTVDVSHPGVAYIMSNAGRYVLSGTTIDCNFDAKEIPYSISDIKSTVFQSRNPAHKAHEAIIQAYIPDMTYTTPFSTTKASDYAFDTKIKVYTKLQELYKINLYVSTLPRLFAGPREALQNCLLFQNLGAKQFIMGRGKNCVGDFYGDSESYDFCKHFYDNGLISIKPIWIDTIYDTTGQELKASTIKPEYIDKGLVPPEELMSSYVSEILLADRRVI